MKQLFAILILLISNIAYADTIPATQGWTAGGYCPSFGTFDSAQAACNSQITCQWPTGFTTCTVSSGPNNAVCGRIPVGGGACDTGIASATRNGSLICPSGYTLSGSDCIEDVPPPECDPGDIEEGGVCVPDCDHPSRVLTGQPVGGSGSLPSSVDVDGCSYPVLSGASGCKAGVCYFEGNLGDSTGPSSGEPSGSAINPDERTPQEKCISQGKGFVESGGVVTCVGAGTPGSGDIFIKDSPSTSDTDGEVTATDRETTVNSDGTVTETTTTTPPTGDPVTTTTTQSKSSFCRENPHSVICADLTNDCPECAKEVTLSNIRDLLQSTPDGDPSATGEGIADNLDVLQDNVAETNQAALTDFLSDSGLKGFYEETILPLSPLNQLTEGTTPECEWDTGGFMGTDLKLSICEAQPALHTALSFVFFILMVIGILNVMTERPDTA